MGGTKTAKELVSAGAQQILERAAQYHIHVIHIEPGPRFTLVRYRRGGQLYIANKLPPAAAEQLANYFKTKAELELNQTAVPQTGRFGLKLGQQAYEVEVDTMPVLPGEKITLSLSETTKTPLTLEELGLWGPALKELKRALTWPHGLVVVGGYSVSGLNLTLSALIAEFSSPATKIGFISYSKLPLPTAVKQVMVKPEIGFSEARQLSILSKENFDVYGLSVINDAKTGRLVGELSAGHLFLAGILAGNAGSALARLSHLKIDLTKLLPPPFAVGQTFVRRLCEHCHEVYQPSEVERKQLDILFQTNQARTMQQLHELEQTALKSGLGKALPLATSPKTIVKLYRAQPHGCANCDHTGFSSEIGLFEAYKPGDNLHQALLEKMPAGKLEQAALKDGMISLKVDGLIKALRGLIDLPTLLAAASSNLNFYVE